MVRGYRLGWADEHILRVAKAAMQQSKGDVKMKLTRKLIALCVLAPVAFGACGGGGQPTLPDGKSPGDAPKDPPPPADAMLSPVGAPVVLV
jgi:hypothetical protein